MVAGGVFISLLPLVLILFLIARIIDFMKKTIIQREEQIAQMNQFLELYKEANHLGSDKSSE